mmetsp:Transcript_29829/g.61584  ORF Transcript_29829/g.61584 Transcript_29829/m.61584 type:complete len:116 (-) Transcript_29829:148-495(-)
MEEATLEDRSYFKEPLPLNLLEALLYRAFVELAEGTKKVPPLPGALALPLSLPRSAAVGLLDAVAPPLLPSGSCGTTARQRWWELRARISWRITWTELANELDILGELAPRARDS